MIRTALLCMPTHKHQIDWDGAEVVEQESYYRKRKVLEVIRIQANECIGYFSSPTLLFMHLIPIMSFLYLLIDRRAPAGASLSYT